MRQNGRSCGDGDCVTQGRFKLNFLFPFLFSVCFKSVNNIERGNKFYPQTASCRFPQKYMQAYVKVKISYKRKIANAANSLILYTFNTQQLLPSIVILIHGGSLYQKRKFTATRFHISRLLHVHILLQYQDVRLHGTSHQLHGALDRDK